MHTKKVLCSAEVLAHSVPCMQPLGVFRNGPRDKSRAKKTRWIMFTERSLNRAWKRGDKTKDRQSNIVGAHLSFHHSRTSKMNVKKSHSHINLYTFPHAHTKPTTTCRVLTGIGFSLAWFAQATQCNQYPQCDMRLNPFHLQPPSFDLVLHPSLQLLDFQDALQGTGESVSITIGIQTTPRSSTKPILPSTSQAPFLMPQFSASPLETSTTVYGRRVLDDAISLHVQASIR